MKLNLKVDSEFTGKHYTLDFDLNPAGMWGIHVTGKVDGPVDAKWTMQKDFTMGEIVVKYKNQNYAFMQLKGNAEMRGMFPVMFDYVVKYNMFDAANHQGKAKLKFDARTPAKRFEINFAPDPPTRSYRDEFQFPFEHVFNVDLSAGFKYESDLKMDGVSVQKATGDYTWVNNGNKFELKSDETFTSTWDSPLHYFNMKVIFCPIWELWIPYSTGIPPQPWNVEKKVTSRNFFFDKVQLNKMKIEEKVTFDGKIWFHIKYDNTAPETAFLIAFQPYFGGEDMMPLLTFEGGMERTANGGFTIFHKNKAGAEVEMEGKMVFDIKANDGSKFEMEHLQILTITRDSTFDGIPFWWTGKRGRRGLNFERRMTVSFDKINKSFLFVPKMSMNDVMTVDGEKASEFVFDNTQAKKHMKFFLSPYSSEFYLFTGEWEFIGFSRCKWTTDLKDRGVSVWNWVGDYGWENDANKLEFKTMDKVVQSETNPFDEWDPIVVNNYTLPGSYPYRKYYNNRERTRTFTYDKKNRNFLLGKVFVEDNIVLDGERFGHFKLDTRATPYTMVWFSQPVRRWFPIPRDFVGQDEMTVSAWHTPGKELKFETNIPEFRTMKITSAGSTKTFWSNGEEKATVDFDSSSKKASSTMHLLNGKDLTIDLAWPKMTANASDLEFGVTITPDRKVVTKFGWEWAGVKKVYLDVVGNNPWIGDYKLSRQGEFEEVSGSVYKMKWTGHGETTKGFLRRVSPVETNVVASVNTRNLKVDAIVWKSFAGQKYGFTLNNDKFTLLAGKH